MARIFTALFLALAVSLPARAAQPFIIGCYELPDDDAALKRMAGAGINLIHARNAQDLDRLQAAGAKGWISLPVEQGASEALREKVLSVVDHPALAVWEGPDEIVWNFTEYSGLKEIAGISRQDWETQQPKAVAYAKEKAAVIIPNIIEGVRLVKELDPQHRPFWINEARESDAFYVRQYLPSIDAIGADDYPIRSDKRDLMRLLRCTDRWGKIAGEKPVWMVLQAFSWDEIGRGTGPAWPTFDESRFMAYGVIAQGADAILYWGSHYLKNEAFRTSLYALTSELDALQPFLQAPEEKLAEVQYLESLDEPQMNGVAIIARRAGDDWLLVLVNRDPYAHLGVEIRGLTPLGQRPLQVLYSDETAPISQEGSLITRMQPYQVKVFCTSRNFESANRAGRDYDGK